MEEEQPLENSENTQEPETIVNPEEDKKSNYLPVFVIGAFIVIFIVFIFIGFNSRKKTTDDTPATNSTTGQDITPEQQLVNALKAAKTDSSEAVLFDLGMAYINNQMYNEAVTAFQKVLVLNPKNSLANNNLGFSFGCIKDWDNGIKYCQIALQLDPTFQLAKNNLAWMQDEKAKAGAK